MTLPAFAAERRCGAVAAERLRLLSIHISHSKGA